MHKYVVMVSWLAFCQLYTCQGHLEERTSVKEKSLPQAGKCVGHILILIDLGDKATRESITWDR